MCSSSRIPHESYHKKAVLLLLNPPFKQDFISSK